MHNYSYRVAVVGVTGYAGRELETLLTRHTHLELCAKFASAADKTRGIEAYSPERVSALKPDAVVLATEHEFSMQAVPFMLGQGLRVLDMSGAFRLKDAAQY